MGCATSSTRIPGEVHDRAAHRHRRRRHQYRGSPDVRVGCPRLEAGAGRLEIDLQNEYLIAIADGEPIAVVPDVICLVDLATGEPVTTGSYGTTRIGTLTTISPPVTSECA
jgi:hypothetical protein